MVEAEPLTGHCLSPAEGVKVEMAEKVKLPEKKLPVVELSDFECPGEGNARKMGIAMALVFYIILLAIGLAIVRRPPFPGAIAVAAWIIFSLIYFGPISNRTEIKRIREAREEEAEESGESEEVESEAGPQADQPPVNLQEIVDRQAKVLGLSGVKVEEVEKATETIIIGKTILISRSLCQLLSRGEIWSLLAHELGHLRAGHVGLLNLVRRVSQVSSSMRLAALPAWALAGRLGNWSVLADLTADRMAALLTRDRRVSTSAIFKVGLQAEELGDEIDGKQVSEYLSRTGELQATESELTTHFKLGGLLREQPELSLRISELRKYAESDAFQEGLEKLKSVSRQQAEAEQAKPRK